MAWPIIDKNNEKDQVYLAVHTDRSKRHRLHNNAYHALFDKKGAKHLFEGTSTIPTKTLMSRGEPLYVVVWSDDDEWLLLSTRTDVHLLPSYLIDQVNDAYNEIKTRGNDHLIEACSEILYHAIDSLPWERFKALQQQHPRIDTDIITEINNIDLTAYDEVDRLSVFKSRVGQGKFRDDLIDYWGRCPLTGISNPTLLVASHIKPWRDCAAGEHLDLFNGLLLAVPFDALFDRALISFDVDCSMMINETLTEYERPWFGLNNPFGEIKLESKHLSYMRFHNILFSENLK